MSKFYNATKVAVKLPLREDRFSRPQYHGETRTHDHLLSRELLYPLSYKAIANI